MPIKNQLSIKNEWTILKIDLRSLIIIAINYVAGVVILVILKIAIIAYSLLSTGNAGASLFGYRSLNSLTSRSYQPLPHNNNAN